MDAAGGEHRRIGIFMIEGLTRRGRLRSIAGDIILLAFQRLAHHLADLALQESKTIAEVRLLAGGTKGLSLG